jgi:hypothetical protein
MKNKNRISIIASLALGLVILLTGSSQAFMQSQNFANSCTEYITQEDCESDLDVLDCNWSESLCIPVSETGAASNNELPQNTLFENSDSQIIQLSDDSNSPDWNINRLETIAVKFLIRAKEALTWTLSIEDGGFNNPGIQQSYQVVLTIVNSLFIIALLAIAAMWMFSLIIPRRTLRKVVLLFSLAVILINFALPLNRLIIDGSNLLQKTLLTNGDGSVRITDIVQTPDYQGAISYQNVGSGILIKNNPNQQITFTVSKEDAEAPLFTVSSDAAQTEGDTTGSSDSKLLLESDQQLLIQKGNSFNIYSELALFRLVLILLTALGYFALALIFVLRIIILWALLILSPALLVLAIFPATRGWFMNWLSLYGRWILIGPITALGVALIINIWKLGGLPIEVSSQFINQNFAFEKTSSLFFYLPGSDTPNTLQNSSQMMEYIVFLLMLYLPIFLGFYLTRQKVLVSGTHTMAKRFMQISKQTSSQLIHQTIHTNDSEPARREKADGGIVSELKSMVSDRITKITEMAFPTKLKTDKNLKNKPLPTASNFLPDNLIRIPTHHILELMGEEKGKTRSHHETIRKLASVEKIEDKKVKEKTRILKEELGRRAEQKDPLAMQILQEVKMLEYENQDGSEVRSKEAISPSNSEKTEAKTVSRNTDADAVQVHQQNATINVNEKGKKTETKLDESNFGLNRKDEKENDKESDKQSGEPDQKKKSEEDESENKNAPSAEKDSEVKSTNENPNNEN